MCGEDVKKSANPYSSFCCYDTNKLKTFVCHLYNVGIKTLYKCYANVLRLHNNVLCPVGVKLYVYIFVLSPYKDLPSPYKLSISSCRGTPWSCTYNTDWSWCHSACLGDTCPKLDTAPCFSCHLESQGSLLFNENV